MNVKTTLIILLLSFSAYSADEKPYTGPSEEDVVVLDGDTLEPTIYSS